MIKAVIWDADGTLLDSMPIWDDVAARYLISIGVKPETNLGDVLFTMSLEEGAEYMKKYYNLRETCEQIIDGILGIIDNFYKFDVQLKPGIKKLLENYRQNDIPMVVATTSDDKLIAAAFKRLGIADYFCRIFTATELHTTKKESLIYQTAARFMGCKASETIVYEDVLHAIRTAKDAGFQTAAVYDEASAYDWNEISTIADSTINCK